MSKFVSIEVKALHTEGYFPVSAILVGGDTGVFAVWMEGDIVHMAAGDDGHWWEIAAYHKDWIPRIQAVIAEVIQ